MAITRAFVDEYAALYDDPYDDAVFNEVSPRVAERGFYDLDDLLAVGTWKAGRAKGYLARNEDDDVRAITKAALAAPDHLKHRFLTILHGVQQPMASALLTAWDSERFTVYDVRAMATLRAHGVVTSSYLAYPEYLAQCRELAADLGIDLRTLDRALFAADRATISR